MDRPTFAQIQAMRAAHCNSTDQPTESQQEPTVVLSHRRDTSTSDTGIVYQRCGGGRRVIRKRIGGG